MSWLSLGVGTNVHVLPMGDVVVHETTPRCVCGPRWQAVWNHGLSSVVWCFVHDSADGRERNEVP